MHTAALSATIKPAGFRFADDGTVIIQEDFNHRTREPWLMLLTRRDQELTKTLCWGLTNNGSSFARIGTQEADLINGFVHEDPYKAAALGQYIFIKSGDDFFSSTWYPQCRADQKLETRFGFGTVQYRTSALGIDSTLDCFIHPQQDSMLQLLTLHNRSTQRRRLELFSVVPVNIGDARDIGFSGFNTLMLGGSYFDREMQATVFRNNFGVDIDGEDEVLRGLFSRVLIHASSVAPSGYGTRYEDFVGHYSNSLLQAAALHGQPLPSRESEDGCSNLSTLHCIIELDPDEQKEIVFSCHAADSRDYFLNKGNITKKLLTEAGNPELVRALLAQERQNWESTLSALTFNLPGQATVNHSFRWLQYQCMMVSRLNRMKSRFHSGFEYGFGFRDILQDILALLPYQPEALRSILPWVAAQMFSDGSVYHNFYASSKGNRDFVACDDPLWLVYAACEYVKESGDYAILDMETAYADRQEGLPHKSGSLLEHLQTALRRVQQQAHDGLPLMLMADWNDDLSDYEQHSSVLCAMQLHKALLDMAELYEHLPASSGQQEACTRQAAIWRAQAATLSCAIEHRASQADGSYIRALATKKGVADLGSLASDHNTFFEPLAWAAFSGVADADRFAKIKTVCEAQLYDDYGIAICRGERSLAERRIPGDYAAWKRSAPGKKENGGEFRHLESWYIASLCRFGYGREAWELFQKTLPAVCAADDPWRYAAEPFVFPEYVCGPDSYEHGRAGHTWLTGTAPTRLGVLLDWILGLRRTWSGLEVQPCVHPDWTEWQVCRQWRGRNLRFSFHKAAGAAGQNTSLKVNGKAIDGNMLTESNCPAGENEIEVWLS